MFPTVKFNAPDEFIAELSADVEHIADGLVRVTRQTARKGSFPMVYVTVIATAVIHPFDPDSNSWPRVIRLERFCGDAFTTDNLTDTPAWKQSEKIMQLIEDAARERGLSVRPGVIEYPTQ